MTFGPGSAAAAVDTLGAEETMWWERLLSLPVLAPNALWLLLPPRAMPAPERTTVRSWMTRTLGACEQLGRVGVFVIPFFLDPGRALGGPAGWSLWALMGVALGVYYAGWARYFLNGREYSLLFSAVCGIPLAMAVTPVVYFCALSALMASPLLGAASAALALGHLSMSWREQRRGSDSAAHARRVGSAANQ